MTGSVAELEAKLGSQEAASFGSIHVQSDDLSAVEQAVGQFVPRLPGSSRGSVVAPPRNGWIAVYDDVCDRNPDMLRRLARELCDRMGAVTCLLGLERDELVRMILFERGSDRRRVPLGARVLRPAAARRRRRAGGEPHGRRAAHRRESGRGAPDRADGPGAGRPASPRASCSRRWRRCSGSRARSTDGRTRRRSREPSGSSAHEGPAPPRLAVSTSGCGTRRSTRCSASAGYDVHDPAPLRARARRSTTGPRSSSATSTDRSSRSERRWAATARSRSRAARPSESSAGARRLPCRRRSRSSARQLVTTRSPQLRAHGVPPKSSRRPSRRRILPWRRRRFAIGMDLTGVVASFGGPLLVCVGDEDDIVSVDEARELAESAFDGYARGLPRRGPLRHRRAAGAVQRGSARLPRVMRRLSLEELRRRLGEDGLDAARRALGDRVRRRLRQRPATRGTGTSRAPSTSRSSSFSSAVSATTSARSSGCPRAWRSSRTATSGTARASPSQVLQRAGYNARNYVGSWHEWSRDPALRASPRAELSASRRRRGTLRRAGGRARSRARSASRSR